MKKAFTLIELLVVIAIIAILAAILFPVFAQAKVAAKRASDVSAVKQVALAQVLYMQDYDGTVAFNRSCGLVINGVGGQVPCQPGDVALGWIDLTQPYVKNIQIFKSAGDGRAAVPLPATGTLCYHWERASGAPCTARNGSLNGYIWGNRIVGGSYVPLGGDFRSSFARNNNWANNGTYTATESQVEFASNTILIYPMNANTGAGANGNEGVPGSTFNINRRTGISNASANCVYNGRDSVDNNRVSFVHSQFGTSSPWFALESGTWSSERFNGGANYAFADTSARFFRPERVKGQCQWGFGNTPEIGNDGSTPDFRL